MAGSVLDLRSVERVHGVGPTEVRALSGLDLRVDAGEFGAVMGPSGSGKSTLLQLAGGLDAPTSGQVVVAGADLSGMSVTQRAVLRRRQVGYVFQDFNLLPALTAAENVAFPLELDGISSRRARRAAREVLAEVGVIELADRRPEEMSGGQAQRVAIARALVGSRTLILADEPTGALDQATGTGILQLLRDRADRGAAVLMVTHEARFAAWADRTVFLRDGRVAGKTGPSDADVLLTADVSDGRQ